VTPPIPFVKMEGCGNDYVYLDAGLATGAGHTQDWDPLDEIARAVSDRHFGVGSDGLIVLDKPAANPRMRMFNADGSEGELCLNGLRCAAKLVADVLPELEHAFVMDTAAGPRHVVVADTGPGRAMVVVEAGHPEFGRARIPATGSAPELWDEVFTVGAGIAGAATLPGYGVSVGNPHLVLWAFHRDQVRDADMRAVGSPLEHDPRFPQGVNIHLVAAGDDGALHVRHWERGSGATLACGSGAVAVFAVARRLGRAEAKVTVHMPGGDVVMEQRDDGSLIQTGPAVEVFRGTWNR
jgi:diaminopimelate epimerase